MIEDALAFGIFAPLTASVVVSKKFVMFSVLTGKTPAGVMAETVLKSSATAKVKGPAFMICTNWCEIRLNMENE